MHAVKKRLDNNIKNRKSVRTTQFDTFRQLSDCESPQSVTHSNHISKSEHRKMQLEKWKEEKEKKKKEAAAQKKKPFVAGVARHPLTYVPPPSVKPGPVGRVTRSQAAKLQNITKQKVDKQAANKALHSFAPKDAKFKAPVLENVPKLEPVSKNKKVDKVNYVFNPVIPKTKQSKSAKPIETHLNKKNAVREPQKKTTRTVTKTLSKKSNHNILTSSSSSETDSMNEAGINKMSITKDKPIVSTTSINSVSSSEVEMIHTSKSPSMKTRTPRKSLPIDTLKVTPKNPIPKSESSSEEKLRTLNAVNVMTPEQIVEEAKKISPCVTMSRGKDNARREMKKKIEEGLLDDDASNMDSVNHFRRQLNSEITRINEMCEVWDKIQEQTTLPEAVEEAARGAVGMARLLVSQKFRQFAGLVERCARPEPGAALVTPADLHGFWDMVFKQVENIDMRFKELETLRQHNWQKEQPAETKQRVVPKNNTKKAAKPAAGPSQGLRQMIAAARKAKKQQEESPQKNQSPPALQEPSRTFEAGFFCVVSPVRSPAQVHLEPGQSSRRGTPRKSMLQAVLSAEAQKSASGKSASFAILRASILSKSMDQEGIELLPQTPVNLHATPGRGILKSANAASEKKAGKKSIKVVLFDHSDHDIQEERERDEDTSIGGVSALVADCDVSCMDVEKENQKETRSRRKPKLKRQDAEERGPVMTRSRRKSMSTPQRESPDKTPRRSARKKKALQESNVA